MKYKVPCIATVSYNYIIEAKDENDAIRKAENYIFNNTDEVNNDVEVAFNRGGYEQALPQQHLMSQSGELYDLNKLKKINDEIWMCPF